MKGKQGRTPDRFKDALLYLELEWDGVVGDLGAYLMGLIGEAIEEAERLRFGPFQRMLAADCLRLHRAALEMGADALTRARAVGSMERSFSKLGLFLTAAKSRREIPGRRRVPTTTTRPAVVDEGEDAA